jgi:hypothetical protein
MGYPEEPDNAQVGSKLIQCLDDQPQPSSARLVLEAGFSQVNKPTRGTTNYEGERGTHAPMKYFALIGSVGICTSA